MKSAILRFRIMAIVAGVMSLLLWFVDPPVVYLIDNPDWKEKVAWIPFVHGWIYALYLLAAIQFAVKARWALGRVIWLALAGTLPVASFLAERKIVKQYS